MLNRGTNIISHKKQKQHQIGSRKQNFNKLCSSSLMTSSRRPTTTNLSMVSSLTSSLLMNKTNAILLEEVHSNHSLVDQAQQKPLKKLIQAYNLKTTVPDSKSKLCQISRHKRSINNLTQLQLVNPKTNIYYNQKGLPRVRMHKMMNHIYYLTALILTICAISTPTTHFVNADALLQSNLQKLKISPDIIRVPSNTDTIKVELHGNIVKPGDPVPAKSFKDLNMAKITWESTNFDARHTLLLLDLDRKSGASNSTNSIYNQFTSLNIPGNVINAGQTIVAFEVPIVPCQPSSKHRVLMLAFHQKENIDISAVAYMSASSGQTSKRENFKLDEFVNRNRLELVAANVFQAIGETNGICSGSVTLNSLQIILPTFLVAMVTAIFLLGFSSKRLIVN